MINALNGLASTILQRLQHHFSLQGQIDQQVVSSVSSTNGLIQQIYQLNSRSRPPMPMAITPRRLLDQRDTALTSLAQVIGITTTSNSDGSVNVSTADGINLGQQHLCPALL